MANSLRDPLLAGEQRGYVPAGFHIDNSPAELAQRVDVERPLILLSSSGTRLCHEVAKFKVALIACLRNYLAVASYVQRFNKVVLIGAATRGEFREEDQICCARIAERLLASGYAPADSATVEIVKRWSNQPANAWLVGDSAAYLRRIGQIGDLKFILEHVADVDSVFMLRGTEVIAAATFGAPFDMRAAGMRVAT
jgi:2-phosphosulfolactate phosphatase